MVKPAFIKNVHQNKKLQKITKGKQEKVNTELIDFI